ncbi:diguanylate cyclase (plasmid) [Pseudomonas luteola]|uniref:sensor domain-containing diguanylate cyclase n=1 Tax=Pseudomonas luteola TaxID=47886 RepID=UPI003DA0C2C5
MKKLRKTKRSLNGLLIVAAALFLGVGGGIYYGAKRTIEDSRWVAHTQEVIANVNEIQAAVLTAESSARGYWLTNLPEYRSSYLQASGSITHKLDALALLVSDNPEQIKKIKQLKVLVDQRLAQLRQTNDGYEQGGLPAARTAIPPQALSTHEAVRELFAQMVEVEQRLLEARSETSNWSATLLSIASLAGIPIGLGMVVLVYWLLLRELRGRAQAEQEAVDTSGQLVATINQLQKTSGDLNALSDYAGFLQSCETTEEALEVTHQLISRLIPGSSGQIYLMKSSKNYLELAQQWGEVAGSAQPIMYPPDCWCLRRGKHHFSEASRHTPNCKHIPVTPAEGESWLCLELASQGVQLGVVVLGGERDILHERCTIAEAAVEQLGLSLSGLQLRATLKYQSTRDDLTGLYNRRYLDESFKQLHARSLRHNKPYSILMIDIDHFKRFNDTYGHAGGDVVLGEVGKLLSGLRGEDIACRYGGEELAVALPETDTERAVQVAERIRSEVQQISIQFNGKPLPSITVSIGVATFPADGKDSEDIRLKADLALYRAKREGRNKVVPFDAATDSHQPGIQHPQLFGLSRPEEP